MITGEGKGAVRKHASFRVSSTKTLLCTRHGNSCRQTVKISIQGMIQHVSDLECKKKCKKTTPGGTKKTTCEKNHQKKPVECIRSVVYQIPTS